MIYEKTGLLSLSPTWKVNSSLLVVVFQNLTVPLMAGMSTNIQKGVVEYHMNGVGSESFRKLEKGGGQ